MMTRPRKRCTRLRNSLPGNSPPQRNLFAVYHHLHAPVMHDLPALLPEVWLHWDPKTVKERGPDAMLRFRMDFLLLLPHGQRVVLEVDGNTHYSPGGTPRSCRYADGVRGDREFKLAGYEVFRFGATELDVGEPPRDEGCGGRAGWSGGFSKICSHASRCPFPGSAQPASPW